MTPIVNQETPVAPKATPKFKVPDSSTSSIQAPTTGSAPSPSDPLPTFASNVEGALHWHAFGFKVIPLVQHSKLPALSWDPWLNKLSSTKITQHWSNFTGHEVGFIVGDDMIVFDADSPESIAALAAIEKAHGITPNMVVKTTKGEHHYYRRAKGIFAKSDSHSTKESPERLDVKTGRALVILPPSTGKNIVVCNVKNASELFEVGQDFIDAVFQHNGRPVPRPAEITTSARDESDSPGNNLTRLRALLERIPSDCGYDEWLHTLMAIYHETGGSEDGFVIANNWSSKGNSYAGEKDIRIKWNSFKSGTANPITIATIIKMAKESGADVSMICVAPEEQFEPCVTEVIHPSAKSANVSAVVEQHSVGNTIMADADEQIVLTNPLDKYSLRGKSGELEKNASEEVYVLDGIALKGNFTNIVAPPNAGKTLLALNMLIAAIKDGRIDPSNLYYLNMDDTGKGLFEKVRIAEKNGFHMLSEGWQGFSANQFAGTVIEMIENDQAHDIVIILDTLKKFVNVMCKTKSSIFTKSIRKFVQKGGTLIVLSHANKRPGPDGKPVYGGTSDMVDDCDCAYTLSALSTQPVPGQKIIEFDNIKRRGNVAQSATYSYSTVRGISYNDLLASVQPVDQGQLESLEQADAIKAEDVVIKAVIACVIEGITVKMKLADAVAERAGVGKKSAIQIIEKYTGNDPAIHRWNFTVGDRGAKVFAVLNPTPPEQGLADQAQAEQNLGNLAI